jgi:hypothetical protein
MKLKLIALLKTSFASKGLNAKELDSLADIIIAQNVITETSTNEDLTKAVTAAAPFVDFSQSSASRQVTEAVKPKPVEPVTPVVPVVPTPVVDPNETPTEKLLKQALEGITKLTAEVANIKGEKVATTRREQYAKTLEGTPEAYKTEALKDFDRLSFKDDTDYTEWLGGKTESVKVIVQEAANGNLGGDRPNGGAGAKPAGTPKVATDEVVNELMSLI